MVWIVGALEGPVTFGGISAIGSGLSLPLQPPTGTASWRDRSPYCIANLINHQGNAINGPLDRVRGDQFIFTPALSNSHYTFLFGRIARLRLGGYAVTTGDGNAYPQFRLPYFSATRPRAWFRFSPCLGLSLQDDRIVTERLLVLGRR